MEYLQFYYSSHLPNTRSGQLGTSHQVPALLWFIFPSVMFAFILIQNMYATCILHGDGTLQDCEHSNHYHQVDHS